MNWLIALAGLAAFIGLGAWYFIATPAEAITRQLRYVLPGLVGLIGLVATLTGRVGLGAPLLMFAAVIWRRLSTMGVQTPSGGKSSTVRSALLEMELDHDTGEMNGLILSGSFESRDLNSLTEDELRAFAVEAANDAESLQLLEAYLDRRMPGWREDMDTHAGAGHAAPAQSGAMTEQEAYQILGLEPPSTVADIRKAHRRLMQSVHPDVGGSAFLAQRINEAKDFLLSLHKDHS